MRKSSRKHYPKKALIFKPEATNRFKKHKRDKAKVYQDYNVHTLGHSWSYLLLDIAHIKTRQYFFDSYGTKLSPMEGRLIPVILAFCAHSGDGTFSRHELHTFLKSIGYLQRISEDFVSSLGNVLTRINRKHFTNPLPHARWSPTTRAKLYNQRIDLEYQKLVVAYQSKIL